MLKLCCRHNLHYDVFSIILHYDLHSNVIAVMIYLLLTLQCYLHHGLHNIMIYDVI